MCVSKEAELKHFEKRMMNVNDLPILELSAPLAPYSGIYATIVR